MTTKTKRLKRLTPNAAYDVLNHLKMLRSDTANCNGGRLEYPIATVHLVGLPFRPTGSRGGIVDPGTSAICAFVENADETITVHLVVTLWGGRGFLGRTTETTEVLPKGAAREKYLSLMQTAESTRTVKANMPYKEWEDVPPVNDD
jgi:hypothetical protein